MKLTKRKLLNIIREEIQEFHTGTIRHRQRQGSDEDFDAETVKDIVATWDNQQKADKVYKLTQKHGKPDKVNDKGAWWKDADGKEVVIKDN